MKYKPLQPIEIHWMDSVGDGKWNQSKKYIDDERYIFHRTVGYYIGETKNTIQVAQSYQEEEQDDDHFVDHMMQIPKKCITKTRKL